MHILYLYIYTLCMGVYIYNYTIYDRKRERCPHLCVSLYSCMYISLYIYVYKYMYTNLCICIYIYMYNTSVQSIVVICEARMASLIKKQNTRTCTWLSSNDGARPTIPRTPSPHLPNSMVSVVEDPMES